MLLDLIGWSRADDIATHAVQIFKSPHKRSAVTTFTTIDQVFECVRLLIYTVIMK